MATPQQRSDMTKFIVERLEDSGLYQILQHEAGESIIVDERSREEPHRIQVLAHNGYSKVGDLIDTHWDNHQQGIYTAHVFYQDGESALVPLSEQQRNSRSLGRYSEEERQRMVHLRGIEKAALKLQQDSDNPDLIYYRPPTSESPEALRTFRMGIVKLDHSYLTSDHMARKSSDIKEARDYRLSEERNTVQPAAKFLFWGNSDPRSRAILAPTAKN